MKLLSIVKELPDAEIILTKEENGHVRVECENVSFKLVGLSEEEFPNEMTPSERMASRSARSSSQPSPR